MKIKMLLGEVAVYVPKYWGLFQNNKIVYLFYYH